MDHVGHALLAANLVYARANTTNGTDSSSSTKASRPPIYKVIGLSLAIASGLFIGVSFVLKKIGLLRSNEKYNEAAGEGYSYLKNTFWWTGMTLMIIGEICNFVAYAFVDAILVTPLGALSVVVTTVLSSVFLKERLSLVGMVGCFLCIVGSIVIVLNAPTESSAANIEEMQDFVISPGFLSYAGVVVVGSTFVALWAGPRYGKKSMLVYLSICSWIGGLSVVATQGLGAAIVTQIGGTAQFNHWFLYVLLVFVITTLVTEIIYLNKALNLFNAALVTPTYYVYFTSCTIITSAILFRGFKGSVQSIITVVMGFFVICSGVVLLQLSKSAKDVPDAAVFAGNLDQVRTIAEQEQPESEPKADAIRGAAAIVRRFSTARRQMELDEAKRLFEEKQLDLEPIGENEHVEWDGLRRRRTTYGSTPSMRMRGSTTFPAFDANYMASPHPPLGMSHFPADDSDHDEENPRTGGLASSFIGSIRDRAKSIVGPGGHNNPNGGGLASARSPMHPVPLTEMTLPTSKSGEDSSDLYFRHAEHSLGLPSGLQSTEYRGSGGNTSGQHITIVEDSSREHLGSRGSSSLRPPPPTPPPHSARRQFSFQNVFRRTSQTAPNPDDEQGPPVPRKTNRKASHTSSTKGSGGTEEERLGLVKGDTRSGRESSPPGFNDSEVSGGNYDDKKRQPSYVDQRDLMQRDYEKEKDLGARTESDEDDDDEKYEMLRHQQLLQQQQQQQQQQQLQQQQQQSHRQGHGSRTPGSRTPGTRTPEDRRGNSGGSGGSGRGGYI